jgi:hypothetical protein
VTRPPKIEKNWLGQCAILRSFLERKERANGSPVVADFDRRTTVVLLTRVGEKLKCGQLAEF